ncbi:PhoX family protein [Salinibius halmophilus]|uniref:PhoX family protein n=1 Tax=Salinibius halmophilus TaxID=1853216 RepID=UPI000E6679AB|nr:PhoX family phosphatase [Salinibius halmophilus]
MNGEKPNDYPVEFENVLARAVSRRSFIKAGTAVGATFYLGGVSSAVSAATRTEQPPSYTTLMGFNNIATSTADTITLPEGYSYELLVQWGDPILKDAPAFSVANTAADQLGQFGDNTDGMSMFHLPTATGVDENRAVFAVNSEYINREFMHTHKGENMSADDVKKEIYAHGVNIFEVERKNGKWQVVKDGRLNRRLHGDALDFELTGPVRGSDLVKTAADSSGTQVRGTLNNCGNGETPWGTYLTCEENFNGYFGAPEGTEMTDEQKAYGISTEGFGYNWWPTEERFNVAKHPNEPNRFGWVVEIDPMNPDSKALKRTAMGRFKHENAALTINKDGHAVAYMGDDERGEFIYKFVSKDKYIEGNRAHNMTLLEEGTLYAAKFNDDGTGEWLELTHGKNGLTAENGFPSQDYVLVYARIAARYLGATTMDRPEWVACHPSSPMVFCTLTNNRHRGVREEHPINAVNPRMNNNFGQIVRWMPMNRDHSSTKFAWDLYVLAGNPTVFEDEYAGSDNISKDNMFNSPDGLAFDADGRMWIQTDGNYSNQGDFAGHGNNQMLCADPVTGHIRRFLVGPQGCEVTGIAFSKDQRTAFVGIQHPTEGWPNTAKDGAPRSAVIAITKDDGGIIGA